MIGIINEENFDKLIKLNNLNLDDLEFVLKKIILSISSFDECYSGRDLQYIFETILYQRKNLNKISDIVSNYSTILSDVKLSYKNQDKKSADFFKQHINQ